MDPRIVFVFLAGIVGAAISAPCVGCPQVISSDELETIQFVEDVLNYLNNTVPAKGTLGGEIVEFIKLSNTTTQVVNGIKYVFEFDARGNETQKIYVCQMSVVVQAWLNKTTVGDYNCTLRSMLDEVEGVTAESIENLEELKELIISELTKKQQPKNPLAITKVLNAHRQLVSGFLTQLTVEVAETAGQGRQVCDTEVWEQPWTLTKEVTKLECNNKPQANICAGCPIEINKDNEDATKCLKRTLFNLNSKAGSGKKLSLHKIIRIQSQVVAGVKYTIEFEAFDQEKTAHSCKTVIISQPWLVSEPTVADFQCTPISQ